MALDEIKKKIALFIGDLNEYQSYLYDRWVDEKEPKNFTFYADSTKAEFEKNKKVNCKTSVFVSFNKEPFGFTFDFEGLRVNIYYYFDSEAGLHYWGWGTNPTP